MSIGGTTNHLSRGKALHGCADALGIHPRKLGSKPSCTTRSAEQRMHRPMDKRLHPALKAYVAEARRGCRRSSDARQLFPPPCAIEWRTQIRTVAWFHRP